MHVSNSPLIITLLLFAIMFFYVLSALNNMVLNDSILKLIVEWVLSGTECDVMDFKIKGTCSWYCLYLLP